MIFTAMKFVMASINIKKLYAITQPVFLNFLTSICLPMVYIYQNS